MKKILAGAALLAVASSASAVAPGGPNCGWGNMLFQGQSGIVPHFLALTTNGTSGNATFGMTTGTNGCSTDGKLTYGGKAMVQAMLSEFSEDVARGEGQALTAVAVAYRIDADDQAHFAALTHANFEALFPHQDVTAEDVVAALEGLMQADARLAKYLA